MDVDGGDAGDCVDIVDSSEDAAGAFYFEVNPGAGVGDDGSGGIDYVGFDEADVFAAEGAFLGFQRNSGGCSWRSGFVADCCVTLFCDRYQGSGFVWDVIPDEGAVLELGSGEQWVAELFRRSELIEESVEVVPNAVW